MFLEIYVPCLIVSNRDQLFKFLYQSISMHSKGQPKNWACSVYLFLVQATDTLPLIASAAHSQTSKEIYPSMTQPVGLVYIISYVTSRCKKANLLGQEMLLLAKHYEQSISISISTLLCITAYDSHRDSLLPSKISLTLKIYFFVSFVYLLHRLLNNKYNRNQLLHLIISIKFGSVYSSN